MTDDKQLFDRKELLMRPMDYEHLKPGMRLASTIRDSNGKLLLRAGVELTDKYINYLNKMQVNIIAIYDDGNDYNLPVAKDVVNSETREAAVDQIKNVLLESKESGRLVIEPESLYDTVDELTTQLLGNANLVYNLVDLRTQDDYTFTHSVNVCVLAIMTGITMGYSKNQLSDLGVGAILHDLGKIKIPDEVLNKPGHLTNDEMVIMRAHTTHGYDLIRSSGKLSDIYAYMAAQHHENFDGSGYPLGLKNKQISEYAQVVAIADRFDAITANRVYRRSFPPFEAFAMCQAAANYFVKESVVRAFVYNIAAYPTSTVVELSNGMIGVALDTPKGHSLFPLVRVYYDENR
ncbi:MAG: HD-GYP domain-containing protein, partial [Peptococcaceae bacterium]|nr:HD-GYP domain-containing protein [Peptococcaceae bacterium]